jgi:hypothetical protein
MRGHAAQRCERALWGPRRRPWGPGSLGVAGGPGRDGRAGWPPAPTGAPVGDKNSSFSVPSDLGSNDSEGLELFDQV